MHNDPGRCCLPIPRTLPGLWRLTLDAFGTNNDSTNYWIFSPAGLDRLFERTGWEVLDQRNFGRIDGDSNPASNDRDERIFCLLARPNSPPAVAST